MRFFALDLHISVIADLKDVLNQHEIIEWSLSGHNWVFNRPPATPEYITQKTWMNLTPAQLDTFRKKYDFFLKTFDGFLVGHAMPYVMLFQPYGKPVYAWNTCRYDLPFCFTKDTATRKTYHDILKSMVSTGQLKICSNNLADQEYLRLGTGVSVPRIPSLCRYTKMKHTPVYPTFYWYSTEVRCPPIRELTPRSKFEWSELCKYRGIVHIPYEISTMSICEHYQSGIPLLFPTKRFLKELWAHGAPWNSVSLYWNTQLPAELDSCKSPDFWLDRADFYDDTNMPFLYYFDSLSELESLLQSFTDVHYQSRLEWIHSREQKTITYWSDAVNTTQDFA